MPRRAAVPMQEFRVADANAAYRGVPLDTLMENAGKAVAREARRRLKGRGPRVAVFCGKGNNGGDGFVAARELAAHARVTVVLAEPPQAMDPSGEAARAFAKIAGERSIAKVEWSGAGRRPAKAAGREAELVLDCLLGSGISGPPRRPYDGLIRFLNTLEAPVLAVDVPSGFPFFPAVRPAATVTIEAPKAGMTRANSGAIVAVSIGFPPQAWTHTGPGELLLIPRVKDDADKRARGVLAVVAGGPYSGAPALVALAAHAVGIGLVHVYTPASVADVVRRFDPTLVVHALDGGTLRPDHIPWLADDIASRGCRALAVGPGLGRARETLAAVPLAVRSVPLPQVIDADAIAALKGAPPGNLGRAILTPHAGEFKAFAGRAAGAPDDIAGRTRAAVAAARRARTTLLLKGPTTIITDGTRVKLNDAGVSAMAVGGAGDVLTGIVGALLAKGLAPFDAGRAGAFIAGKAGEAAFEALGHSLKPTDLIAAVPRVMARYLPWWGGKP
jgi:NAD(P)H-hydrate epimerase